MKHLIVINPAAGKRSRVNEISDLAVDAMAGRGEEDVIRVTEYPGNATEIVESYVSDGADWRVYACGGDGTLNEVLCGMAEHPNAALTQFACGTGNDFLRFFGVGLEPFRDIKALTEGEEREFDLIRVNGHYAINICSVGFDARVAGDVHRFSKLPLVSPFAAFTLSALTNLFRGLCYDYKVDVDGANVFSGKATLICVASARYYGGGYMPMADTDPTDGVLDVLIVGKPSRLKVPMLLSKYKAGRYEELAAQGIQVLRLPASEVTVDLCGRTGVLNADGEVMRTTRASIALAPQKVRFFAPKGCFGELDAIKRAREAQAASR